MLFRVAGYAFVGWILWKFGKKAYINYLEQSVPEGATAGYTHSAAPNYINMSRCDYCGLNIPSFEVVARNGKKYCCKEHAKLAKRDEV
ncbi:hypothetical protein [Candidatus Albibeggiatoa sp. nov. NOAA]|uniref:hypothetical protein n=1 Tax=Candidatus Albibeggiatoa sp. nov. NOAA TaxID=3162724 RepID=UPI0032F101CC|nr:hypothetical protein [Thiotrichaceae bacterium]